MVCLGLKKNRELRPELVTLDLEMPRMDGIVCSVRSSTILPFAVIVVSTTHFQGAYSALKCAQPGRF